MTDLRCATEDTVTKALERGELDIAASPAELLELFNQMLDIMGVPDQDGDVCEVD